jgi:hypothetical protein
VPLLGAVRFRLAPALLKVSSFEERAHLLLESQQALVHKIQALIDLSSEIFFRTLRVAPHYLVREASPREPGGGSGESRSGPGEPRRAAGAARQAVRVALDSAHIEGSTPSPSRTALFSAPPYALSHAASHTAFRTRLGAPAPTPSAHVSLLYRRFA